MIVCKVSTYLSSHYYTFIKCQVLSNNQASNLHTEQSEQLAQRPYTAPPSEDSNPYPLQYKASTLTDRLYHVNKC